MLGKTDRWRVGVGGYLVRSAPISGPSPVVRDGQDGEIGCSLLRQTETEGDPEVR